MVLLAWMLLIAWLSTDAGSSVHTRSWVAGLLARFAPRLADGAFQTALEDVDYTVRKIAHLSEYGVLAWLALCALAGRVSGATRRSIVGALMVAVVWAITDEIHQLYVPGRTGCVKDVLFDTVGAIVGLAVSLAIAKRLRSRSAEAGSPAEGKSRQRV